MDNIKKYETFESEIFELLKQEPLPNKDLDSLAIEIKKQRDFLNGLDKDELIKRRDDDSLTAENKVRNESYINGIEDFEEHKVDIDNFLAKKYSYFYRKMVSKSDNSNRKLKKIVGVTVSVAAIAALLYVVPKLINSNSKSNEVTSDTGIEAPATPGSTELQPAESSTDSSEETTQDTEAKSESQAASTAASTEVSKTDDAKAAEDENLKIEKLVEDIYKQDKEFYEQTGMNIDDIRNMYFVINDKYKDVDGNLLMDENDMLRAYDCINEIMYSASLDIKIKNITDKDYDIDNFDLIKQPSLVSYVNMELAGSKVLVDELKEYEQLRDKMVEQMNKDGKLDVNAINTINEAVIKNEVTDINSNSNPISAVRGNGQKYLMAATHSYRLAMAGAVNNDVIYLTAPEYDGIPTVKINYTIGERDVIGEFERMARDEKYLSQEQYDNIVSYVKKEVEIGVTDKEIVQGVSADYDLEMDYSNLIVAAIKAEMSMSSTSWHDIMCSYEAVSRKNAKKVNTESKNTVKKLIFNA